MDGYGLCSRRFAIVSDCECSNPWHHREAKKAARCPACENVRDGAPGGPLARTRRRRRTLRCTITLNEDASVGRYADRRTSSSASLLRLAAAWGTLYTVIRVSNGRGDREMLMRFLQRSAIFGLGIFSVWLIVFVVFETADRRLPWILALGITYGFAAYVVLPRVIRLGLKILKRKRVPSYTITGDGLPGDPVNVALVGTLQQLRSAFAILGWSEADRLGLASSWGMIRAFVFNSPYPTAPFSTLYLFGRGQDIGFQKAIDNSPRKRHHVRFWALSLTRAQATWGAAGFWLNTDRPPDNERVLWVGAGTRDTGLSLTRLTFQITHATDSDTNAERDHIIGELTRSRTIEAVKVYQSGQDLLTGHVNHYVTDGEVALASLVVKDPC
jgi:hypothetical protein